MNEADRIAEQRLRQARETAHDGSRQAADHQNSQRRDILQQIRRETQQVLSLLERNGYPEMVSLTFQESTFFAGSKPRVRGAWHVGTFHMPESSSRPEGREPLHLLSDGSFAAFGYTRYHLDELDDEVWWERAAPQLILHGLRNLRARLTSG